MPLDNDTDKRENAGDQHDQLHNQYGPFLQIWALNEHYKSTRTGYDWFDTNYERHFLCLKCILLNSLRSTIILEFETGKKIRQQNNISRLNITNNSSTLQSTSWMPKAQPLSWSNKAEETTTDIVGHNNTTTTRPRPQKGENVDTNMLANLDKLKLLVLQLREVRH